MAANAASGTQVCAQRETLIRALDRASWEYSRLVIHLTANMGRLVKVDYDLLRSRVENARIEAEHAREMLLNHCASDRC
jgi:hypothetical protein